jgi:integrase
VLNQHVGKNVFSKTHVSDIDYEYANALWLHINETISTHKANHTFKVLKIIWNESLKASRVKSNPFALVKLPVLPDRRVLWELEHIEGMVKYCDEQGYVSMGSMITMCFEFCQRPVDVRRMKWANLDGRKDMFNFVQQKTGKKMRIKVTNSVQKRLHLHSKRNSNDNIFINENNGQPYTQDRCNKVFRKLAEGYGLPEVELEDQFNDDGSQKYSKIWMSDLRRTGATHASQSGCTDRQLMALTGHKNPAMLVVYAIEGETESTAANTKRGLL